MVVVVVEQEDDGVKTVVRGPSAERMYVAPGVVALGRIVLAMVVVVVVESGGGEGEVGGGDRG